MVLPPADTVQVPIASVSPTAHNLGFKFLGSCFPPSMVSSLPSSGVLFFLPHPSTLQKHLLLPPTCSICIMNLSFMFGFAAARGGDSTLRDDAMFFVHFVLNLPSAGFSSVHLAELWLHALPSKVEALRSNWQTFGFGRGRREGGLSELGKTLAETHEGGRGLFCRLQMG